jgi:hypothetical protein
MNATPRSARLSSPGEVIAILVGSGVISVAIFVGIIVIFTMVLIPSFVFGGREQIPSDLPVYPGAHLDSAFASGFGGCIDVSASWSTPASSDDVSGFYRTQLNTGPWTLTDTTPTRGGMDLLFTSTSGPHREGDITVIRTAGGGSSISLELAKSTSSRTAVSGCHVLAGQPT